MAQRGDPRSQTSSNEAATTRIYCRLAEVLEERAITLTQLSKEVGVSVTNLSLLKNNHVRAIRYSTLEELCRVLKCQPGDLFIYQ